MLRGVGHAPKVQFMLDVPDETQPADSLHTMMDDGIVIQHSESPLGCQAAVSSDGHCSPPLVTRQDGGKISQLYNFLPPLLSCRASRGASLNDRADAPTTPHLCSRPDDAFSMELGEFQGLRGRVPERPNTFVNFECSSSHTGATKSPSEVHPCRLTKALWFAQGKLSCSCLCGSSVIGQT
ncbi:unnamed protein product [Pleuronectes platessa]|uniref:Uncharacterized protein n=1 Tax=Pleuronectes platessa TaxID=8262 RepID=A0A9N7VYD5_PLEPL|nr:unnamed protein product [Pleuronectes platessa]